MPELPEVETTVRDLAPALTGRALGKPRLHRTDVLRNTTRPRLLRALSDNVVRRVWRRAKHAVFDLDDGRRMVIQPRMTGVLMTHNDRTGRLDRKYVVLEAHIEDGIRFLFRDVRRLGTIRLLDENNWRLYNSRIGPEPLDPGFTIDEFVSRLSPSRQAIKKTMMDQKRIAGVGNIYANEALFRAGIHPRRQSNRLRPQQWDALYRETLAVLREAIASRGTTLRDYRTGKGDPGGFQFRLLAYGRGGQPCARCDTLMKTTHAIDGRASTYCWRCQGRR